MKMKKKLLVTAGLSALLASNVFATDISVNVTNLTKGIVFTPLFVSAHESSKQTFVSGTSASVEIQAMAEGGDTSGLNTFVGNSSQTIENPNGHGPLLPGTNVTATINNLDPLNTNLTVLGMMLPTNDGFIALNSIEIPSKAGVYTYYLNAYDAGTEHNDELVGSIPNPPLNLLNTGGTGVIASGVEGGYVHIHRGTLGDTDAVAGKSDIDSTIRRWLNPVARVQLTVN
jgi:hypothetical protein